MPIKYKGTTYVPIRAVANLTSVALYPQGNYQTLALQIAILGEEASEIVLRDLDSNAVLRTVAATGAVDGLVTIKADIAGVQTVVVEIKKENNASGGFVVPLTTSYYK